MYSMALVYRHRTLQKVANFAMKVDRIGEYPKPINAVHDGYTYRRSFRSWFINESGGRHKLANNSMVILFTGYNFRSNDLRITNSKTQGLAYVETSCNWIYTNDSRMAEPCILVEARSYRAVFIAAHELGHTLGMYHDEGATQTVKCGKNHIMSETTGSGKVTWSHCSQQYLNRYIIEANKPVKDCLFKNDHAQSSSASSSSYSSVIQFPDDPDISPAVRDPRNYMSTSVDLQCQTALGLHFKYYRKSKFNICNQYIVCTNGMVNIDIGPAIENTTCGVNRYCIEGKCD
ncbi:A disintegrin and metalloproteinase with thrombospondin motifs adt-2-like [Oppia nitens]|uniref:A disintegrin and metalloproteinase with thrombospondin motifs adt-2-like n=1 Tax=Oppia nitens TaxID=1686743 RepID=UPI0023DB9F08|nr:A disintegrin and metalloproteinase with thrombospondin motifs adt-2-like [Oppia nitens]